MNKIKQVNKKKETSKGKLRGKNGIKKKKGGGQQKHGKRELQSVHAQSPAKTSCTSLEYHDSAMEK